jgi:hypothetical protein
VLDDKHGLNESGSEIEDVLHVCGGDESSVVLPRSIERDVELDQKRSV